MACGLLPCLSGLLCAAIGLLVATLNCAMPEKMREAFSIDGVDEEDVSYGDGFLSSLSLDDSTPAARVESIYMTLPCP